MIIVDIETTGLDPKVNSILSIGALAFHDKENQFYAECRIQDTTQVSPKALRINGFSWKEITDQRKPSEKDIVKRFMVWAVSSDEQDLSLMGHNIAFDISFLRAAVESHWHFGYRSIDLHSVAYAHLLEQQAVPLTINRVSALSLNQILQYLRLPKEPEPHNALIGAKLEAEAFSRIVLGRSFFKNIGIIYK